MPDRTAPTTSPRLISLDALRGLAVAGMILVNNPGRDDAVVPGLRHAAWHGVTGADFVFPLFLFVAGASLEAAAGRRRGECPETRAPSIARLARRALWLASIGLALNLAGPLIRALPSGLGPALRALHGVRIPGVLQRIALGVLVAGVFVQRVPARAWLPGVAIILAAYAALLALAGADPYSIEGNICGVVDRRVFTPSHLLNTDPRLGFDPEGLVSTIPCVAGVVLGAWTLRAIRTGAVRGVLVVGAACVALGLGLAPVVPLNKQLWTATFALLTGGAGVLALVALHAATDARPPRGSRTIRFARVLGPFATLGRHALVVYVASELASRALRGVRVAGVGVRDRIVDALAFVPASVASLVYACAILGACWGLAWLLTRLGWRARL